MRSGVTNDPYQAFENMTDEVLIWRARPTILMLI